MKTFISLFATLVLACSARASFCPGDVNVDLRVDVNDIVFVLAHWGDYGEGDTLTGGEYPPGDANHDGRVDVEDIALIISVWGLGGPTNPHSCYPVQAPTDASPECITSVFEAMPFCEYYWDQDCSDLMCQDLDCYGSWCPN